MGKTDAEGAPTGQELLAELILACLAYVCRVNRTQAAVLSELLRTPLCGPPNEPRRTLLSLPKAPRPRALLLRTDAGVTNREHPADQARKGNRGREGTEHTRDTGLWRSIHNTFR
jgi:hypothetical protein